MHAFLESADFSNLFFTEKSNSLDSDQTRHLVRLGLGIPFAILISSRQKIPLAGMHGYPRKGRSLVFFCLWYHVLNTLCVQAEEALIRLVQPEMV